MYEEKYSGVVRALFIFFIPIAFLFSQHALFPPDFFLSHPTLHHVFKPSDSIHPTLYPLNELGGKHYRYVADSTRLFPDIAWDEGIDFFFYNPLLNFKPKDEPLQITLNPILHLYSGFNNADSIRYRYNNNSRGIVGNIRIKDKVHIETFFVENQSFFPQYLNSYCNQTGIVPGQGRFKVFKKSGFDYAFSAGLISFQATKNLNIQVGHFKNKIGSGYRSILLSDQSFVYPQIKITSLFRKNKIQYTYWAASLMDLQGVYATPIPGLERLFRKKPLCMQYLHLNLHSNIKLGLFQSLTGEPNDGENRFKASYGMFVPVPYLWPLLGSFSSNAHILWGTDLLVIPLKGIQLYAQWAIRNDSTKSMNIRRQAWQAGIRHTFRKMKNFSGMVFAEINEAPKNFYGSGVLNPGASSYYQYGESMGLHQNLLREFSIGGILMKNRWGWQIWYGHQQAITSPVSLIQHFKSEWFYLFNRSSLLTFFISYHYRFHDFPNFTLQQNTLQWWNVGIRTRIYGVNYEF